MAIRISRKDAVRFNALLELSGSDKQEEARTAAYLACKILRDIGIRFRIPPEEKEEEDMRPKQEGKTRVRVHDDELHLEHDVKDHEAAGWVYDEARSVQEMKTTGVQCMVMTRGKDVVKFLLDDTKSEPPRSDEGYQDERETTDSLEDDEDELTRD